MFIEKEQTTSYILRLLGNNANTAMMFGTQLLPVLDVLNRGTAKTKVIVNDKIAIVSTRDNILNRLRRNGLKAAEWRDENLVLLFKDVYTKVNYNKKDIPFLDYMTMKALSRTDVDDLVELEFDTSGVGVELLKKLQEGKVLDLIELKEIIDMDLEFVTPLDQYYYDLINSNENKLRNGIANEFYIDYKSYYSGANRSEVHLHKNKPAKVICVDELLRLIDEIYDTN